MNKPYVYIGHHKTSGHFYIGYRKANRVQAHLDLGLIYKTSSKKVKELGFENFNWIIIAEFIEGADSAYRFEQELIVEHFNDPLCLNAHFVSADKKCFKSADYASDETKAILSIKCKATWATEGYRERMKIAFSDRPKISEDTRNRMRQKRSAEGVANIREAMVRPFKIISPEGEIIEGVNIKQFCADHGLHQSRMSLVCRGLVKSHKGWTCDQLAKYLF